MRIILFVLAIIITGHACAQKIYGTVFTENGDLLPYASITIKGTSIGASTNDKARFSFNLSPGTYTVICQHLGYTAQEKKIILKDETEITFILPEQKLLLKEVTIKSGAEDPAYEIIRQAIRKRNFYFKQVNAFQCQLYGKDLIKLRNLPKKILGKKIKEEDRKEMGVDSAGKGIIYLSESMSTVYKQLPDKFKLEVQSSRVSGSGSFGFTFPSFISLYSNNVQVFNERINPRGFISPIADGAISFYRFKFLGTFYEAGKAINSIRVTPRRLYEPLFSGIINITDDDWRIHSFDLMLTKTAQLEILDTLQVRQLHVPVSVDAWMVKNQLLHFNFKMFGIDAIGNFLSVYSDYNIEPVFGKKFFDRIVIKYDTAVNKKTVQYWDSIRPVPLEPEEMKDYKTKDSIYKSAKDSALTQNDIDSLKKKQGKIKPLALFWNGINRTHYNKTMPYTWRIDPLIKDLEYNTVEGVTLKVNASLNKYLPSWKTNFSFQPHLRYGFSNTHLNVWASFNFRTREIEENKKIKRFSWNFAGGKRVSEFNKENPLIPLVNSIGILFFGNNYIKTYENWFGNITWSKRYESGLNLQLSTLWEDRIPIDNSTNFTFFKKESLNITPNYPYEKIGSQFISHQAFIFYGSLSFRPGQKYIQLPYNKISLGSKYPTFTLAYAKGLNKLLGSDVDFDKWKFTVADDKNLKLAGLIKYKLGVGGFLNRKQVFIQDYQHFNGNRSLAASEYVNSFQLASFYGNSTTASLFGFGHAEHHFNGLLTNKIPLFRKLSWNLVAGSNAFFVNNNNNYVEIFAGLENILKLFRVDFVAAFENGKQGLTGIRIGTGGSIGSGVKTDRRRNEVTIQF